MQSDDIQKFSIRMISSKCNIGIGTIYKYYGNKDDILIDITKELWMSYINEVSNNFDKFTSFSDYIEYLYDRLCFYSKKFNYQVLSRELSVSFRTAGKSQHKVAQSYFIDLISRKIRSVYIMNESDVELISNFIANNLISIITMQEYEFHVFINILSKLLINYKEKNHELL